MLNIYKFAEYLDNSRKFISRNKEFNCNVCKISLRKNFANLKLLKIIFDGAHGINRTSFG